jgi:hypothetical protein
MCFIVLATLSLPAQASMWGGEALTDADLDAVRGGFLTEQGVRISFGIERAVSLNGVPQTTQSLRVGEAEFAAAAAGADLAGLFDGRGFVPIEVIQNNLDGQLLQTATIVDVRMIGLDLIREYGRAAFLGEQIMLLTR